MKGPSHTNSFDIVGLLDEHVLSTLLRAAWIMSERVRRLCALIVPVALDLGALRRQMKLGFDARDHCRGHELACVIR